jgi:hypothetical protein
VHNISATLYMLQLVLCICDFKANLNTYHQPERTDTCAVQQIDLGNVTPILQQRTCMTAMPHFLTGTCLQHNAHLRAVCIEQALHTWWLMGDSKLQHAAKLEFIQV